MLLAACGETPPPPRQAAFVDIAAGNGITQATHSGSPHKLHVRESLGQGVCWIDYDRDHDPDLLVLNGARETRAHYRDGKDLLESWQFFENRGGRFRNITPWVGMSEVAAWAVGCAVGDVDADGFDDLFVTTAAGPNRLLRNTLVGGRRRFTDVTAGSGLGAPELSASAAFGDLDGDGDLDLFVTTYLDQTRVPEGHCQWKGMDVMCGPKGFPMLADRIYRNQGDGSFSEVSAAAGIDQGLGFGLGVVLLDSDDDGDLDIYVANDSSPNRLWINAGDWRFSDQGLMLGVAYSEAGATQAGMGVDSGDLDGDGRADLVVTNFSDDVNNFYRYADAGYQEWTSRSGIAKASYRMLGWSVLAEDFDLDGDLDLFIANGHVYPQVDADPGPTRYRQRPQLLINDGNGRFSENRGALTALPPASARGAAVADFDGDGDMDLVVTRDGEAPWLLRNDLAPPDANWLGVRLRGLPANAHGLGAKLRLRAGGKTQYRELRANRGYLSASQPIALFGLGQAGEVDTLEIQWPDGATQVLHGPASNRMHDIGPAILP